MPIIHVYNPLVTDLLNTITEPDASQHDIYSSIFRATNIVAGEVAKNMNYYDVHITTIFGKQDSKTINNNYRIVCRIRSGLPMAESLMSVFKGGKISHILLNREIDSKILYSTVGNINRFEKIILCEPLLIDDEPIKIVIDHLLAQGATQNNIMLVLLSSTKNAINSLDKEYPNINFYLCQEDDFIQKFFDNNQYYDDIGSVIFGDHPTYNALKAKYFHL